MTNHKYIRKKRLLRYLKYLAVGFPIFSLELLLLRVFLYNLHFPAFLGAGVAFLIAETISHIVVRKYVFSETTRSPYVSYILYLSIAGASLIFVSFSMHILVEIYHFNPFLSRIGIGIFTGIWNFSMNLFFNFKVAHQ